MLINYTAKQLVTRFNKKQNKRSIKDLVEMLSIPFMMDNISYIEELVSKRRIKKALKRIKDNNS